MTNGPVNTPSPPTATEDQVADLANTVALQAEALATGQVPQGRRYAHVRRLLDNAQTLAAWVGDDRT